MKRWVTALKIYLSLSVLCGLIYPALITGIGQTVFAPAANGGLIVRGGKLRGVHLLAQPFVQPRYFWPRPSANAYDAQNSGGSNLGPIAADLVKQIATRATALARSTGENPPAELLLASGSGLDPHLTPAAALYQAGRVARARAIPLEAVVNLIQAHIERRVFEPAVVNVVELNLDLDELKL